MKYFVLKPEGNNKYAEASRKAMRTYASVIRHENPKLSNELFEWAHNVSPNASTLNDGSTSNEKV